MLRRQSCRPRRVAQNDLPGVQHGIGVSRNEPIWAIIVASALVGSFAMSPHESELLNKLDKLDELSR